MKVTYQDNSIQEFFVWIESDGDIVIAKASDETHGEGYDLREDNSKNHSVFRKIILKRITTQIKSRICGS